MNQLLEKLTQAFGVSGSEDEIRSIILQEIECLVDETRIDPLGNLIGIKKGSGKKIMIASHMDEIGLIVTYIDEKGFLKFSNIGGICPYCSLGQRVRFRNGIVGALFFEGKLLEENKSDFLKGIKLSQMYIDIGASNKAEAQKFVAIGDTAAFTGPLSVQNGMITAKAMDDRAGCAVLIETLRNLPKTENELYFVFTAQEELGLRGAKTAAFGLLPEMAIAVDVTPTGDTPGSLQVDIVTGGGPALKIKDGSFITHISVKKRIEQAAQKENIRLQYEVLEYGGTDPGEIHITASGIPSGAISLPCRYIHSPVETLSLSDLHSAVKLLTSSIIA